MYTYGDVFHAQILANIMATRCDNGKFSKANRLRSNANLHRGPSSLNTLDRTENEDIIEWKNGRRIVELGKLAEGLGCPFGQSALFRTA